MIKVNKVNNVLNVSFDYDADIVAKIKTVTGRKYIPDNKSWDIPLQGIKKLIELFEDKLDISDDVDIEYQKPKYDFKDELETIINPALKIFAKWSLEQLPDYFYQVAASSTGKYHPAYTQGEEGLVRHTQAAVRIANELFNNDTVQSFTEDEKDIIRVSLLLHDGVKHGTSGSSNTVSTHPLEVIKYLKNKYYEVDEDTLPDEVIDVIEDDGEWDVISNCISSHMGQWNTDYKTKKEILPKPTTEVEKFTHLCDYLASRKMLEVNFNVEG